MPESRGTGRKDINARADVLRASAREDQRRVTEELNFYNAAAKDVKKTAKDLEAAERAYEKRDSARNARIYDEANAAHLAAKGVYRDTGMRVNSLIEAVRKDYVAMSELYDDKRAERVMDEFDRYNDRVTARILNIQELTGSVDGFEPDDFDIEEDDDTMAIPEIPVQQAVPAPQPVQQMNQAAPAYAPAPAYSPYPQYMPMPMPMPIPYPYPQQGGAAPAAQEASQPKIAPVSIDVSPMIEKALEATMAKFAAAFDKKLEDFMAEHEVNLPVGKEVVSGATHGAGEIAALEGLILDDEQALIDKLTAMIENLKVLANGMAELGAVCAELFDRQNTVNEMQKQTNDMQRQTLRDQKGIQVGQRVIVQDQVAVTQNQATLQEQQKAVSDNQKALAEAQQSMEETQRLVAENQATIEEAMKNAMQVQKDMIAAQQSIIAGNAKNVDAQNDIVEKQAATLALQKEALVAQRQMLRDQKSVVDKQKSLSDSAPKKRVKAKQDIPAEEETAGVAAEAEETGAAEIIVAEAVAGEVPAEEVVATEAENAAATVSE